VPVARVILPEVAEPAEGPASLLRWAWLSVAAALVTIAMKATAYLVTGSVGLLSDALESVVNLVAAILALIALGVAAKPADRNHPYGHGKAEYFAAGAEGLMILAAALAIMVTAIQRLFDPQPLDDLGIGLAITLIATLVNGAVGLALLRAGRAHRSIALVADGKHLLTDVWTSVGVLVGVGLVAVSGWVALDSIVAIAVGINITWTGIGLVRHSQRGLMDHALSKQDEATVHRVLQVFLNSHAEVEFHAIQTREAGRERFISLHVLVPGAWTIQHGHDLLEEIEGALVQALPGARVHTHLEPREDPASYRDWVAGHGLARDPELP
jgi:cation diffusion facilitator family transporter